MSTERIQIKLNGRRFEFAYDSALENLSFLKSFFASTSSEEERKQQCDAVKCSYEKNGDTHMFVFPTTLPHALPDYFGLIQVALRKGKEPALKWDEMNRREQEAVVWIVNTFKIDKYLDKFGKVTATVDEVEIPQDQRATREADAKAAENLAKAHMKIVETKEEQQEREAAVKKAEEQRQKMAIHDDEDEDNVFLSGMGCFLCGTSTHNTEDCPHKKMGAVVEEVQAQIKAQLEREKQEEEEAQAKKEKAEKKE